MRSGQPTRADAFDPSPTLILFVVIHKFPGATPDAVFSVQLDGQDYFRVAIPAVASIFVRAVQENLVKQLYDGR